MGVVIQVITKILTIVATIGTTSACVFYWGQPDDRQAIETLKK